MPLLLDGVKESTTTTGTGDVTLAGAETGYCGVSDHSEAVDGCLIYGCLESGDNREIGVYRWNSSGDTLTRVEIHSTLTAGVFDDTSPTPLSLSDTSYFMSVVTQNALPSEMLIHAAILNMQSTYGTF